MPIRTGKKQVKVGRGAPKWALLPDCRPTLYYASEQLGQGWERRAWKVQMSGQVMWRVGLYYRGEARKYGERVNAWVNPAQGTARWNECGREEAPPFNGLWR